MVRCFPCALDFGQSSQIFFGISAFLNIIFPFPLAGGKLTAPNEFHFFNIFPPNFFFNPRYQIEQSPGHLDRVYKLGQRILQLLLLKVCESFLFWQNIMVSMILLCILDESKLQSILFMRNKFRFLYVDIQSDVLKFEFDQENLSLKCWLHLQLFL